MGVEHVDAKGVEKQGEVKEGEDPLMNCHEKVIAAVVGLQ